MGDLKILFDCLTTEELKGLFNRISSFALTKESMDERENLLKAILAELQKRKHEDSLQNNSKDSIEKIDVIDNNIRKKY